MHFHFCRRQKWKCALDLWLLTSEWKSVTSTVTEWVAWRKWKNFGCIGYTKREFFFIYLQKKIAETNNLALFGCTPAEVRYQNWQGKCFWICLPLPYNVGHEWWPRETIHKKICDFMSCCQLLSSFFVLRKWSQYLRATRIELVTNWSTVNRSTNWAIIGINCGCYTTRLHVTKFAKILIYILFIKLFNATLMLLYLLRYFVVIMILSLD